MSPDVARVGGAVGAVGLALLFVAHAHNARADDAFDLKAADDTRLAYVITGLSDVDDMSRAGLTGLGLQLRARTSYEPQDPMGVDVAKDDLSFFPLLYWPMDPREKDLSPQALSKISDYMRNGGTIEEGFSENAKLGGNETIRHHIIAYLPERLLVLQNEATPPGPPHAELYRTIVQVISVEPRGKETRLTISHTGYRTSADYDQLYAFFHNINHSFLDSVKTFCETKT